MPRTGARASALDDALVAAGLTHAHAPSAPRLLDLPVSMRTEVGNLYRRLGGIGDSPAFRPGQWDLSYEGLLIELDEDLHFNRYRAVALEDPFAHDLPWAFDYRIHAAKHENRSGTGGRRWTNSSAERMFGAADDHWVFDGNGAPRWKQRALYDAIKDAAAASGVVRLSRISVYDEVDGVLIEDALRGRKSIDPDALRSFVESRTLSRQADF